MLSSHLNCVEIRCSETRIQDPAGLPVRTEAGVEEEVEEKEETLEGSKGERRANRHLSIPLHSSVPLVIMARWKDLWGPGLGRKFANFHDRARIISGWLGGFRT